MTTRFKSAEAARAYVARIAGLNPASANFIEDDKIKVVPTWLALMDESDPEYRTKYDREMAGQKGYRLTNAKGNEVGIVVAPFRDGFCVWAINLTNEASFRL